MTTHAHKYHRITLEKADGTILTFNMNGSSEPVFLLRGQDMYAAKVVGYYADLLEAAGLTEQAEHATEHSVEMDLWRPKKQPD